MEYWETPSEDPATWKATEEFPAPWKAHGRGNGHTDLYAANGKRAAYVFCWDVKDCDAVIAALARINGERSSVF